MAKKTYCFYLDDSLIEVLKNEANKRIPKWSMSKIIEEFIYSLKKKQDLDGKFGRVEK